MARFFILSNPFFSSRFGIEALKAIILTIANDPTKGIKFEFHGLPHLTKTSKYARANMASNKPMITDVRMS
jgi:hypothetical protein